VPRHSRVLSFFGATLVLAGMALVGVAAEAYAHGPSISFRPKTPLVQGEFLAVFVRGSGLAHHSQGALMECSASTGQPTIDVLMTIGKHRVNFGQVPVSCSHPQPVKTEPGGTLPSPTVFGIYGGVTGPPAQGIDSSGNSSSLDASGFPCPPTSAQTGQCEVLFVDAAGQHVTAPIDFSYQATTTSTASTTTQPCNAQSVTVTATPPNGTGTVTVDPGTCLVNGTVATIKGTGLLSSSSSNYLGAIIECNSDPDQPTIATLGAAIPVSCTSALADTFTPNASGNLNATFTIVEGTTGPPTSGDDSSGNPGSVDAPYYPCPPTPAQEAGGDRCQMVVSDSGGDKVVVPISFNPDIAPPPG
jgi:hypothetical protein